MFVRIAFHELCEQVPKGRVLHITQLSAEPFQLSQVLFFPIQKPRRHLQDLGPVLGVEVDSRHVRATGSYLST